MKKLTVKKDVACMACLECVRACSTAFYKEFNEDYSCIRIVAKGDGAKPNVCIQSFLFPENKFSACRFSIFIQKFLSDPVSLSKKRKLLQLLFPGLFAPGNRQDCNFLFFSIRKDCCKLISVLFLHPCSVTLDPCGIRR